MEYHKNIGMEYHKNIGMEYHKNIGMEYHMNIGVTKWWREGSKRQIKTLHLQRKNIVVIGCFDHFRNDAEIQAQR